MVCPNCGAGAQDDAKFCLSCGASLGRPDVAASEPPAEPPAPPAPPPRPDEPDRIACPRCTSVNSGHRELCGRCGADLRTGEPAPVPSSPPEVRRARAATGVAASGPDRPRVRRGLRTALAIVVIGVVVGGALGALAAAGIGPFASDGQAIPMASFDPGVYTQPPAPVEVAEVVAGSTRAPSGDERYEAPLIVDGDTSTAWNGDGRVRPHGVGETLTFRLAQPTWLASLVLANGDQGDVDSFPANARLERVRIGFDGHTVLDVALLDERSLQRVPLDPPILAMQFTITVLDVFEGDTYEDLALSEVEVVGWSASEQDARIARERAEAVQRRQRAG